MSKRLINVSNMQKAAKGPIPKKPKPQLATLVDEVPTGKKWIHEWKLDGYRILCRKKGDSVTILTRRSKDWTGRFQEVAKEADSMDAEFILDGEMVVMDENGLSNFQRLQNAMKGRGNTTILYYVFDILYLNGYNLSNTPLLERKKALMSLLESKGKGLNRIKPMEHQEGEGPEMLEKACGKGMEGIISKRSDSKYSGKRNKKWRKIKCLHQQEFVIGGYTKPKKSRKGLGSILVGYYNDSGELIFAGKVGTGFTDKELKNLSNRFKKLERKTSPFKNPPKEKDLASWITPEAVCEVKFEEWTKDDKLRQPSYLGLREDKKPESVKKEETKRAAPSANPGNSDNPGNSSENSGNSRKKANHVTHPDKILYPDPEISKGELAEYYEETASRILPYIIDRPLSIVRCPSGHQKSCFFQKHVKESMGKGIYPVKVPGDNQKYISIRDTQGLIDLVQLGTLEIHPWGSRKDKLDKPDFIVFDIDPGEGTGWQEMKKAAGDIKSLLDSFGLESFLKTSGGKGLHVYIPIERRSSWKEARDFAHAVSTKMMKRDPAHYIDTMSKEKRSGKVFIDYLRNSQGSTSVAPYSTRAKKGAPISAPLRWEELSALRDPGEYTMTNMNKRLSQLEDDPWQEYFAVKQSLTKEVIKKAESE